MQVTRGKGLRSSRGWAVECDGVDGLIEMLAATKPDSVEEWWSPHRWTDDSRERGTTWLGAPAVVVDIDLKGEAPDKDKPHRRPKCPVDPWADVLLEAWEAERIVGNAFHLTPHGIRVVFLLNEECADATEYTRAVRGATELVAREVRAMIGDEVHVESDVSAMADRKRLIWMPSTTDEKGKQRRADVYEHFDEGWHTFDVRGLGAHRPAPPPPKRKKPAPPPRVARTPKAHKDFEDAKDSYLADTSVASVIGFEYRDAPNRSCPVCAHSQCFGPLMVNQMEQPGQWVCYSSNHVNDAPGGIEVGTTFHTPDGRQGWKGDTLDLAAWSVGTHAAVVLVNAGHLDPNIPPPPPVAKDKVPVFIPQPDPMFVSTTDFVEEAFAAVPPGTFYRFTGDLGVLRRSEGRLGHQSLRPTACSLVLSAYAEGRMHRATKQGPKKVRTNFGMSHGGALIDGGATHPSVRELRGVYTSPHIAGDFDPMQPGWNPSTGLYYDEPPELAGVHPDTEASASVCRELLDTLLADFYDVLTAADVANAVGLMVTTLVRSSLVGHPVPLHFANAAMEGSGKSILF